MTELTKDGVRENFDALTRFAYNRNHDAWLKFCADERGGRQDVEQLSMLVSSITSPNPWRVVMGKENLDHISKGVEDFAKVISGLLGEIKAKMDENEKLVDGSR